MLRTPFFRGTEHKISKEPKKSCDWQRDVRHKTQDESEENSEARLFGASEIIQVLVKQNNMIRFKL